MKLTMRYTSKINVPIYAYKDLLWSVNRQMTTAKSRKNWEKKIRRGKQKKKKRRNRYWCQTNCLTVFEYSQIYNLSVLVCIPKPFFDYISDFSQSNSTCRFFFFFFCFFTSFFRFLSILQEKKKNTKIMWNKNERAYSGSLAINRTII